MTLARTRRRRYPREILADRYTLDRELGRGGMATVYLAHDLKHDRPVALEVMHPELAATLGPEVFFDPLLHPLRKDPRFRRVEERMGLTP